MVAHTGRLLAVLESFTDGATEAQDLLQETWIVAWHNAHRRRPGASSGSWLYSVALNVARTHVRNQSRRRELMTSWRRDATKSTGGPSPSLERGQLQRRLWRCVAELPPLQQEVLLKRIVDGMSTKETAHVVQKAEGTVKTSLHRAIRSLRQELGEAWTTALKTPDGGDV